MGSIMSKRTKKKVGRRGGGSGRIPEGISVFPGTPADYDPVSADPDELASYGIPPKPDERSQPERFEFWRRMFSGTWEFVDPEFKPQRSPRLLEVPTDPSPPGTPGARHEASLNWSGAYLVGHDERTFTQVHAQWEVPTPHPPALIPAKCEYRSSAWVGFDGQRRYRDSSLPQIGTGQWVKVVNGQAQQPVILAWCQWWIRKSDRNVPFVLSCLDIAAGQLIMCSLVVKDPQKVAFYIRNESTRQAFPVFDWKIPYGKVHVSGATVEWIMERPMVLGTEELYRLADYKYCRFERCHAVSAFAETEDQTETLKHAKLIKMYEIVKHPHRTVRVSTPHLADERTLETSYG
jgi:hypothetical protein